MFSAAILLASFLFSSSLVFFKVGQFLESTQSALALFDASVVQEVEK